MHNIIVIGIAGGSGSGKTTLADKIIEHFGDDIAIVHQTIITGDIRISHTRSARK